jgi:hypothetical protein
MGCGGESTGESPADTGEAGTDGGRHDASLEAAVPDGGVIDIFDAFPLPEGGCAACVRDQCGEQINACANSTACREGLLCVFQMCAGGALGDAGRDLGCVLQCFKGDLLAAASAISGFTCVGTNCGEACTAVDGGADDGGPEPDAPAPLDAEADAPTAIDAQPDAPAADAGQDAPETSVEPDAGPPVDGAGAAD